MTNQNYAAPPTRADERINEHEITKEESLAALVDIKHDVLREIDKQIRKLLNAAYQHADRHGAELYNFDVTTYQHHYEKKAGQRSIRAGEAKAHIIFGEVV